jgi:hypothetical protein
MLSRPVPEPAPVCNSHIDTSQEDGQPGSNTDTSNSASSLVSTLIPNLIVAAVLVTLFMIFRPRFKRLYAPRTYIDSLGEQCATPLSELDNGMLMSQQEKDSCPQQWLPWLDQGLQGHRRQVDSRSLLH